jgi:hypothetical protein
MRAFIQSTYSRDELFVASPEREHKLSAQLPQPFRGRYGPILVLRERHDRLNFCVGPIVAGLKGGKMLELSAPRTITFVISAIIALVAAVIHYAHLTVPYIAHSGFTLLFVGYLILAAGNLLRNV